MQKVRVNEKGKMERQCEKTLGKEDRGGKLIRSKEVISERRKYFDALLTLGGNKEAELNMVFPPL